jgi:sugar phosphate isomerase/epimerase
MPQPVTTPVPLLSYSTLACPNWGWEQTARGAANYGYNGVEVRMIAGDVDLLGRPEMAIHHRSASRRVFEEHGIAVCGLASSVRFDYDSAEELARQLDVGRRYLDLAQDLGARFVRVFGDVLPPAEQGPRRERTLRQIAEGLTSLGEYAQSSTPSVRVILETHGDFSDSLLAAKLFANVSHPSVGLLWDTHHPWRFHGEPLDETLARLGERVWHTHWKDSVDESAAARDQPERDAPQSPEALAAAEQARRLMSGHRDAKYDLFGEGEFPAQECLRLLLENGYTGWFSLEWEKAWHPELADPEIALPQFPPRFRRMHDTAAQNLDKND